MARDLPTMGCEWLHPRKHSDLSTQSLLDDEGFVELHTYTTMLRIIARISARMFVGLPLCRDEEWLQMTEHYTEDVFKTVMALRMLPRFLHSSAVWLLPSSYRVHRNLRRAKQIIGPIVKERRNTQSQAVQSGEAPNDMLQWMMDAATEDEGKPEKLAHRQLVMTLGAIHTTTMAVTHVLYDLCAHPEYFGTLREEVDSLYDTEQAWDKSDLTRMAKLDSFLKESQRFNPPAICELMHDKSFTTWLQAGPMADMYFLVAFNRVAMESLKLSDGITIPKGTHFVVPSADPLMDATIIPDPSKFDPLRCYRKRLEPDEANRHQYTMTTNTELHFGHGRFSCPGRFFAAVELKLILSHLLRHYELKLPPGGERPVNQVADDNIFPNVEAVLLIRRRQGVAEML